MGDLPDFAKMTKEEIGEWFMNNDTSELIMRGERPTEPLVQVDRDGVPVMRPATFRLPPAMLDWLQRAAGRDREGRSGIVRRALEEYQERHYGNAA